MKNKYERLSKEEKKEARMKFKNSEANKNKVYERINRAMILGALAIMFGLIAILENIIKAKDVLLENIYFAGIIIVGVILSYYSLKNRDKLVNKYLIDEMKKNYSEELKKENNKNSKGKKK